MELPVWRQWPASVIGERDEQRISWVLLQKIRDCGLKPVTCVDYFGTSVFGQQGLRCGFCHGRPCRISRCWRSNGIQCAGASPGIGWFSGVGRRGPSCSTLTPRFKPIDVETSVACTRDGSFPLQRPRAHRRRLAWGPGSGGRGRRDK